MSNEVEPFLDADDIQGNIIPGFNRRQRYLVAFSCTDKPRLQAALAAVRPHLTTMSDAFGHRDDRKQAFMRKARAPMRSELWVNLALSVGATDALGATGVKDLDDEDLSFTGGMKAGLLGDAFAANLPDGEPNRASRIHWRVGSPATPIDLLLIFAHDDDVEAAARPLVEHVSQLLGSSPVYREQGNVLPGEVEHFGFREGISQPGIRGRFQQKDGSERLVTTRYGVPSRDGIDFGKTGQPLVWPGQFLTGQPTSPDDQPNLAADLTNGSFLVFRRLSQDVKAFYRDTDTLAGQLTAATGQRLEGSDLRTKIVGRFMSGASVMRHEHEPMQPDGPNEINYFAFGTPLPAIQLTDGTAVSASAADPDVLRGRRCPVWAHTRKVNPRDQGTNRGGPLDTIRFQMLRRGIPFGPAYDHLNADNRKNKCDRGLLFLSYQRRIKDQFSILNHDWMNNRDAPQAGGFDLLVGQNVPDGSGLHEPKSAAFFLSSNDNGSDNTGTGFATPTQWIIPTGGAFLFAPSLTFVAKFSGGRHT